MFSRKDRQQIEAHGIGIETVMKQLEYFKIGFPYLKIDRPAIVGDGIIRLDAAKVDEYADRYHGQRYRLKIVKFVPASGAATRMFKELFEFVDTGKLSGNVKEVLSNIEKFAFGEKLLEITGADASDKRKIEAIIRDGLGYGNLPKGLILFHKYPDGNRTAAEEHLAEGGIYAIGEGSYVNIHFTVSPEHIDDFRNVISEAVERFEEKYGVTYRVTYSVQAASTDTIAVNPDNTPFRNENGSLLFRPAGHGALIENLNSIDADIIFIKNIDNVAPDSLKGDTVKYKSALAGLLLELQGKAFEYLDELQQGIATPEKIEKIIKFVENKLMYRFTECFNRLPRGEKIEELYAVLNRPLRVCGMVRNEGEPGGGPFWVVNPDGGQSLQIAETSQISPERTDLISGSTHFNPVDLVCAVKDHEGNKFDLLNYVDPDTGFISMKSKDGRELKAQELPGLWNGAMARWNTVFVEVPSTVFSPVKIVNDLLRPQHQQSAAKAPRLQHSFLSVQPVSGDNESNSIFIGGIRWKTINSTVYFKCE